MLREPITAIAIKLYLSLRRSRLHVEGYTDGAEAIQMSYVSKTLANSLFNSINVRANVSGTKPSFVSAKRSFKRLKYPLKTIHTVKTRGTTSTKNRLLSVQQDRQNLA